MIEQNTPEWLEMRRSKIGASDAAAVLGISPYDTPYQLWEKKVLGKKSETTRAMLRGHAMEEEARQCFEKLTGIITMPKVVIHPERTWQMASLDGITFEGTTIVEIKCPNKDDHSMAENGSIPDHYMAQIQHQLSVTGALKAYYFSYNGQQGALVEVFADDKFIHKMLKEEEKFYEFMISKEPPPLTDRDYIFREDAPWKILVDEYKEVKAELDILKQCEEGIREKLIDLSGKKNSQGCGIKLTHSVCKGQVDYKLVPELVGIDLEPYRKPPCEKWRISVKEET